MDSTAIFDYGMPSSFAQILGRIIHDVYEK